MQTVYGTFSHTLSLTQVVQGTCSQVTFTRHTLRVQHCGSQQDLDTQAFEQQLLAGEEDIGDVARLAIDAELVTQVGVESADEAHHRAPQLRRQQAIAALATALEQVDEGIGFAEQQARAPDARATPDSVSVDATQLEHSALDGSRELPAEDGFLRGSGQAPGKGCVLHRRIVASPSPRARPG